MKAPGITRIWIFTLLWFANVFVADAITFTSDTSIAPDDFSVDGQDIVVTNCTVTINGSHGFNSLQVLNAGVLTHSPYPNGIGQFVFSVSNEVQTLSVTNPATLANTNVDPSIVVMDSSGSITYTQDVDYIVTTSNQFTQLLLTTNSAIAEGTNVLVSYIWAWDYLGVSLAISNDMQVATGGTINLSGKGYGPGIGLGNTAGASQSTNFPFTFTAGGGGAHGGSGGMSSTSARGGVSYGSTTNPATIGSGGGLGSSQGGKGGGVARVFVGGMLQVDGQIFVDGTKGTNAHSGGGAGGGLMLSAQTFSGAGSISANGGSGELPDGGGGGGGRIAIYFATNNFIGTISAFGGAGANYGGAGTIYMQAFDGSSAQLQMANNGHRGTNTLFLIDYTSITNLNLTISGGAVAQPYFSGVNVAVNNLLIGSNSWLNCIDSSLMTLVVNGDAIIESNGLINADFKSSFGSGGGGVSNCGSGTGGGYGGNGGASICGLNGGNTYGSFFSIATLGSPGGGSFAGRGGGAVNMTVGGTLSLLGKISANGASPASTNGGAGSGGGIQITVGALSGNGSISANGGAANNLFGGGGGGGRIAVLSETNLFTGSLSARGGLGVNSGGAGSIYVRTNGNAIPQLKFDNAGATGYTVLPTSLVVCDLTITGGAIVTNSGTASVILRTLFIGSNSWFTGPILSSPTLTVTATNATIQTGGGISADNSSTSFSGSGQFINPYGSGGGNAGIGGYGGTGTTNVAGGALYGFSVTSPTAPGGRGGALTSPANGGGVITLTVSGTLQLDGQISANGANAVSLNGGGGGGGSISVSASNVLGAGLISAKGGIGNSFGGGGGGGRIAFSYTTNQFIGSFAAQGGAGGHYGGPGTLYTQRTTFTGISRQTLTIDNGGNIGTNSGLTEASGFYDLNILGGTTVSNFLSTLTIRNLFIGSNSVLCPFFGPSQLTVLTNATIENSGVITVDGVSTSTSNGGQSSGFTGGGGALGGNGGNSLAGAQGGTVFNGTYSGPVTAGSRGGAGSNSVAGGNGGGAFHLTVNGTLQLDGKISADGVAGPGFSSGGGSGGAVWITANKITGTGLVSANGGPGSLSVGGGGGGGRIAINYNTNQFSGTFSARGGAGGNAGGAGTIYLNSSFINQGGSSQLFLDNGGMVGAVTLLSSFSPDLNLTIRGGALATNGGPSSITIGSLFIGSNSVFQGSSLSQTWSVTNATIQASGRINFDGLSVSTVNMGQSINLTGGGGGHGGYGGMSLSNAPGGTAASDGINSSTVAGSRGGNGINNSPGGNGGGSIHLTASGTLQLDGKISADGVSGVPNSGGGAGGALWLQAGRITGTGTISANGGSTDNIGGGGGGGRVTLWYNTNQFSGSITARGGTGANAGGAGTIYVTPSFFGSGIPSQLIVDNGGNRGTNTPIIAFSGNNVDFSVNSGAFVGLQGSSWRNITISSNGVLGLVPNATTATINITSNLTIQPGGAVLLDGQGSTVNNGTGHGGATTGNGGGGGHGGYGSAGILANATGGMPFDSLTSPTQPGSGGGAFISLVGSAGGGAMQITVGRTLAVNGTISANGKQGVASGAGGGAGGSLWLSALTLSGSGKISADGGDGEPFGHGGGGSGGRIAIYFNTNQFAGTYSAHGGAGPALSGAAGTIYLKTNNTTGANLVLNNGGTPGTNTPVSTLNPPFSASVSAGAALINSSGPLTFQNLSVNSGGTLKAFDVVDVTAFGDTVVSPGGLISADAHGYDFPSGPGQGHTTQIGDGSGGGYGGVGGASINGAVGGVTYGSSNQPTNLGSRGGITPFSVMGYSQGGGAIRLKVNGTLTVNGIVTANGADAATDGAGGGSGGSIWVTAQNLAGNGYLLANGGLGELSEGGGGGGGRIAINANTNAFSGNIFVVGGEGANPGQDGTIYISTNLVISGSVSNTSGFALEGITLQPSGLNPVLTDSNGFYSVSVPPIWSGTITPTNDAIFVPASRTYANLYSDTPSQDFIAASLADFDFSASSQFDGTNAIFNWYGINGVSYQPLYSTNLIDWFPYGSAILGTNGPASLAVPTADPPQMFFRLNATY